MLSVEELTQIRERVEQASWCIELNGWEPRYAHDVPRLLVALESALTENARLRDVLFAQWLRNHAETCSFDWPHPEGSRCHWPLPSVLAVHPETETP